MQFTAFYDGSFQEELAPEILLLGKFWTCNLQDCLIRMQICQRDMPRSVDVSRTWTARFYVGQHTLTVTRTSGLPVGPIYECRSDQMKVFQIAED